MSHEELPVRKEYKNPTSFIPDTGYGKICAGCQKRHGTLKTGTRVLEFALCDMCEGNRERHPVKHNPMLRDGIQPIHGGTR